MSDLGGTGGRVIVCVTVDVEDSDLASLMGIKEVCQKYSAPVTWFVETKLCNQPDVLDMLKSFTQGGDEVGIHIHWEGSYSSGLRSVPIEGIKDELEEALKLSKSRFQVKSFRGGGLCQTTPVLEILQQEGFEFDSSVAYNLDESNGWYQGHENIHPVSAYYPSKNGYDVIAHDNDNNERFTILELPVTRAAPSPRFWCNILEPGVTSLPTMKLIFKEYCVRRHFQPLVFIVLLFHSWTGLRHPNMLIDLDKFLNYVSRREVEFNIIRKAGYEWRKVWEDCPGTRGVLTSCQFNFDLRTRLIVNTIMLALLIHNLKHNPGYYIKTAISRLKLTMLKVRKIT